jgi:hypothetical protein
MFKCEICHDWCSRIEITKQWWNIARNDWESLNGKDLPYYIAILAVLRETTKEIFYTKLTSKNHSMMVEDFRGYSLMSNKNCKFIPLIETQKNKWHGFFQTIRIFRNGAAHLTEIQHMNPLFHNEMMNSRDSSQDYYRYAPFPDITDLNDSQLKKIHEFVRGAILIDVRSPISNIPSHRVQYEIYHVERGLFIDLLHNKMIELLKEVKSY